MSEEKSLTAQKQTALAPGREYFSPQKWNYMTIMAKVFIKAKALPVGIDNAEKLMMVLQTGYESGMKPMEAIRSFYFVNGKLTIYGRAQVAQVIRAGYDVEWGECNLETATVTIIKKPRKPHTETYTMQEAELAGLPKSNAFVWGKYPKNMLRWKAFGNAARFYCPEALDGLYNKEEMEASMDEPVQAEVIDVVTSDDEPAKDEAAATDEQITLITELMEKAGVEDKYKNGVESLTFDKAEALIKKLKEKNGNAPTDGKPEVIDEEVVEEPKPAAPTAFDQFKEKIENASGNPKMKDGYLKTLKPQIESSVKISEKERGILLKMII